MSFAIVKRNPVRIPWEENARAFPTVLVTTPDNSLRRSFVNSLQESGYLILVAESASRALEVVIEHSRPIQILLVDMDLEPELSERLKPYRPEMKVICFSSQLSDAASRAITPRTAVGKVRELLAPRESRSDAA